MASFPATNQKSVSRSSSLRGFTPSPRKSQQLSGHINLKAAVLDRFGRTSSVAVLRFLDDQGVEMEDDLTHVNADEIGAAAKSAGLKTVPTNKVGSVPFVWIARSFARLLHGSFVLPFLPSIHPSIDRSIDYSSRSGSARRTRPAPGNACRPTLPPRRAGRRPPPLGGRAETTLRSATRRPKRSPSTRLG